MNWIEVDEKQKNYRECIVFAPQESPSVFTASMIDGSWHRSCSNEYAPINEIYGDIDFTVTHWMPLPEPPAK